MNRIWYHWSGWMEQIEKIYEKAKASPSNLTFDELCYLVEKFGYVFDRWKGDHKIYKNPEVKSRIGAMLNIQKFNDGKAKSYQVREALRYIEQFRLGQERGER